MSIHQTDALFERAVDEAADLLRDDVPFYEAVSRGANSYRQDWFEVQHALAERSANARSAQAAPKANPVKQIKQMCREWRKAKKVGSKSVSETPNTLF